MSLIERLKNPEDHYEFTDPKKANAVLMSLCQEAADALASPVHKPYRPLQDNGSQYFGDSWDTPPAQPAPVQVSPLEFVTMVMEKEHLVGKPLFWAEWPNKEKNS